MAAKSDRSASPTPANSTSRAKSNSPSWISSATTSPSLPARSAESKTAPSSSSASSTAPKPSPSTRSAPPTPNPAHAFLRTVTLSFPSGRTAEEIVVDNAAGLAWVVNLGCIELHPHPVRSADLDHPDELRIDLDPGPGVPWEDRPPASPSKSRSSSKRWASRGWPKTSGSRGMHVNVRIHPRWTFTEVRQRRPRPLPRRRKRRAPTLASSKWWKEERHGVFLDYNQNAKDRTTCSAYSVRPAPRRPRLRAHSAGTRSPTCQPRRLHRLSPCPSRFNTPSATRTPTWTPAPASLDQLSSTSPPATKPKASATPPGPHTSAKAEGEGKRVQPLPRKARPAAKSTSTPSS